MLYPGDGVDSWRRLFPELKVLAQDGEQCGDTMAGDDSEEDEDYCPPSSGRYDSHDGEDQLTSGDESDSGGSGVGEEEEDHDDNGLSLKDELVALRAESGEDSQDVVGGREGMSLRSFRGMDKKDGSLDGLAEDDPLSVIGRFVSKTIKGYLLRGQVLSYHPSQSSLPTPSSLALSSKRKVSAVKAPEPSSPLLNRDGVWYLRTYFLINCLHLIRFVSLIGRSNLNTSLRPFFLIFKS